MDFLNRQTIMLERKGRERVTFFFEWINIHNIPATVQTC